MQFFVVFFVSVFACIHRFTHAHTHIKTHSFAHTHFGCRISICQTKLRWKREENEQWKNYKLKANEQNTKKRNERMCLGCEQRNRAYVCAVLLFDKWERKTNWIVVVEISTKKKWASNYGLPFMLFLHSFESSASSLCNLTVCLWFKQQESNSEKR